MGLVLFIGWVAPSCVCTDIVLDSIVNKLHCSMFHVKQAMKRVSVCVITSILGWKWHLGIVIYLLVWLFLRKGRSAMASSHYFAFALFTLKTLLKLVIYTFMGHDID